jgi:hypothetical protein
VTVRVRKARRSSRLSCGCYVLRGCLITERDGTWICIDCALAAIRAAHDHPAPGGAAQEGTT